MHRVSARAAHCAATIALAASFLFTSAAAAHHRVDIIWSATTGSGTTGGTTIVAANGDILTADILLTPDVAEGVSRATRSRRGSIRCSATSWTWSVPWASSRRSLAGPPRVESQLDPRQHRHKCGRSQHLRGGHWICSLHDLSGAHRPGAVQCQQRG